MWKQRKKLRKKILHHNFALDLYKYLSNAPNNNSKNDETEQNELIDELKKLNPKIDVLKLQKQLEKIHDNVKEKN